MFEQASLERLSASQVSCEDIYYLAFPYDSMATKVLVFVIFIFESLQTLLLTHDAFGAFGAGWGNPEALSNVQWLGLTIPIMSGISESLVQR